MYIYTQLRHSYIRLPISINLSLVIFISVWYYITQIIFLEKRIGFFKYKT